MKWVDYREKLGIGLNDSEKGQKVTCGLLAIFGRLNLAFSDEELVNFLMMTGDESDCPGMENIKQVFSVLNKKKSSFSDFLSYYIAFINSESSIKMKTYYRDLLFKQLNQFNILYEVIEDQDGVFVLPKGAPELDAALVSASLEWLSEYPDARKLFVKALIMMNNANEDNASNVVDAFRKALECFFQLFFPGDGKKSLENYMPAYSAYLKSHNVAQEIANNLSVLLKQYTIYDNNFAKHQDRANARILEYWMYQTFNVVRLLITLKREDDKHS